ncbi:mitochondrial carrier domain-containing protein [Hypoxylon trugodes]|uniref:mitochondrial carrier domain-containing protein n=1 Tax=Hypoxylon trugodes TaxID=326681 RepID=UPI002197B186|nr:mitochondrial carrier domain-containing protein [Hypoxylon trugodes]KAI1391676.1 mitochondrial carrier domain-containing protein [Hypoxylon trugodes]
MSTNREGVNPLRPYYIPPSIGEQVTSLPSQPNPFSHENATTSTPNKYASRARDIFSDIDYKDHLDDISPSTIQSIKSLIDELLWKYTSVMMAQPFEVAKTVLQVRIQDDLGGLNTSASTTTTTAAAKPSPSIVSPKNPWFDEGAESDSDPEEAAYFTSNIPNTPTPSTRSHKRRGSSPTDTARIPSKPIILPHQLSLKRPDSIFDVISQLWSKESAWGIWKGTNATFLYTVLQSLFENWSRSLLSALLNVPDLGLKDDVDRLIDIASPYPWASLCVAAAAAVATGLILAPLDLVRTRLIITSTGRGPRRTLASLRSLPSWFCAPSLIVPTILNSLVHPFLTLSTPLVLRSQFLIDRELSPMTFSVAKFCTSCASLFVKLPLETILRRGQVAVLSEPLYLQSLDENGTMDTIVQPGPYKGVLGTMYTIVAEEGSRAVFAVPSKSPRGRKAKQPKTTAEVVYRKGQGFEGLWRGWKVSWWGLVGLWTAGVAGGGGEGEF